MCLRLLYTAGVCIFHPPEQERDSMITVNGDRLDWHPGITVRDVLVLKNYKFRMLVTKINGILVKRADYDTTTIPDGADVQVIHLISGG